MKKITIAISGLPVSGTSTLGKCIAKKFGLKFFSTGSFFKKFFEETSETLSALEGLQSKFGRKREVHEQLDKLQIEVGKKGNVVVVGKLAIYMLRKIANVKIWVEAPLEIRAKRAAKRDKIGIEEARKILKERERLEKKVFKKIYGIDYVKDQKKIADILIENVYKKKKACELLENAIKEILRL